MDSIADRLEKKGLVKEAFEIDRVADHIDRVSSWGGQLGVAPNDLLYMIKNTAGAYLSYMASSVAENPQMQKFLEKYKRRPPARWVASDMGGKHFSTLEEAKEEARTLDIDTTIVEIRYKKVGYPS